MWFSINEKLPEPETQVLIYIADCHFIGIDTYSTIGQFSMCARPEFRTYGSYVTHWMPLPAEPV